MVKIRRVGFASICLVFALLAAACEKAVVPDDRLSLKQLPYEGRPLRIDGYYYQEKDGNINALYAFYKDGTILYLGGGFSGDQLSDLENSIRDGSFYRNAKEEKDRWGLFRIDENEIRFEKWNPSIRGPMKAIVREGLVLNDTTFQITLSFRNKNGTIKEGIPRKELYHFKSFSPKPDSTNNFINEESH